LIRRLLNLLTALSLLLCVAATALWVRSHRGGATLLYSGTGQCGVASAYPGYLMLSVSPRSSGPGDGFESVPRAVEIELPARTAHYHSAAGIGYVTWPGTPGGTSRLLMLPFRLLAPTLALAPAAALAAACRRRLRRRRVTRRQSQGLCSACAYDLTANLSGVCPECGSRTASA
jgi:hypothetical protein